jgi:multicomponent K+:H+ antiporter subunit A
MVPALATFAALCSVAYSVRLVHDVFFNGPPRDLPHANPHEPPLGMKAPVALLTTLCVVVGVLPGLTLEPMVRTATTAMLGRAAPDFHLAIWHGFNLPLLLSMLALAAGATLYLALARGRRLHGLQSEAWFGRLTGQGLFHGAVDGLFGLAGRITARLETGSLQRYVAWMLAACVLLAAAPLFTLDEWPGTGTRTLLPRLPVGAGHHGAWCWWPASGWCAPPAVQSVVWWAWWGLSALTFVSLSAPTWR